MAPSAVLGEAALSSQLLWVSEGCRTWKVLLPLAGWRQNRWHLLSSLEELAFLMSIWFLLNLCLQNKNVIWHVFWGCCCLLCQSVQGRKDSKVPFNFLKSDSTLLHYCVSDSQGVLGTWQAIHLSIRLSGLQDQSL